MTATTADADYVAKSGTIDFAPGETLHTVVVSVTGDDALELDETFEVQISSPVHATLGNAIDGGDDHEQRSDPSGLGDPERDGGVRS